MNVEERLVESLGAFGRFDPSPDLFARVELGVAEDRLRRRRFVGITLGVAGFIAVLVAGIAAGAETSSVGVLTVPRWSIELAETMVLGAMVVAFGPAIRRFGSLFVAEVFEGFGDTGERFLRLLDVAYYLVFAGFILMSTSLQRFSAPSSLSTMVERSADRVGSMLLLMGLMHAATLSALPLIGLIHASTVRKQVRGAMADPPPASPAALRAERITQILVWLTLVGAVLGFLFFGPIVGGMVE